jgi:hypothetical protein
MAGDWIKMRVDLNDDPAVICMADSLDVDEYAVIGRLHKLWCWADRQTADGHANGVTNVWLDRYVSMTGFADAMHAVGWLHYDDNGVTFPSFDKHNGTTAKRRAENARRQQLSRARRAECVTDARPEKRREEKRKKKIPPKPPKGGGLPSIPDGLDTPEFRTAWDDYIEHRSQIRKKMTPKVAEKQLKACEKIGPERAVTMIEHSIAQGWTGLYEPSSNGQPFKSARDTLDERIKRDTEYLLKEPDNES